MPKKQRESIINKTPIDAVTNRSIGGYLPSQYLHNLETNPKFRIPANRLDEILSSHLINPALLRNDDFPQYFDSRKEAIIALVEKAMGKKIIRGIKDEEEEILEEDDSGV